MEPRVRIALLIDADNADARTIDAILTDLATYGQTDIRRAYGNWTKPQLKGWIEELHGAAIRPMQQFDLTTQKNASDMALAIDAVELLHSVAPDAFAIVSSDSDFTPLAHYLREKGCDVYGYGRSNTPAPFVSACTRFTDASRLGRVEEEIGPEQTAQARKSTNELKGDSRLTNLLRNSISAVAEEDGWARVTRVGQQIRNQSSLDWRNYGYAKLIELLRAVDLFELRDEGTSAVAVRDKRAARRSSGVGGADGGGSAG
jgi:uncharacterized LabA/DUF88 family protein